MCCWCLFELCGLHGVLLFCGVRMLGVVVVVVVTVMVFVRDNDWCAQCC